MSADNWGVCPVCWKVEQEKAQKHQLFADEAYGKVPPDEYLKMLEAAKARGLANETLRENWEVGTRQDGVFLVWYVCFCNICGFSQRFEREIDWLSEK